VLDLERSSLFLLIFSIAIYVRDAGVAGSRLRRCGAKHDASNRLLIPEILYRREREIGTLLASFDRVVTNGTPELVLVSGHAGIGKKVSQRA
jgi:predicted ATP-dependent serine protease